MAFEFVCPYCHSRIKVDDRFAGQAGPCAECGKQVTMPGKPGSSVKGETSGQVGSRFRNERKATNKAWPAKLLGAFFSLMVIGSLTLFSYVVFFPSARNALGVRQRTLGLSNAKQIADALNAYRRIHGSYPTPIVVDSAGNPLYSWRVLILPQLGYSALYNQYQLDQPFDSPTNIDLMTGMPPVFACPGNLNALAVQETNFALITGPGSMFPPSGAIDPEKMLDKPSETLLVVETTDGATLGWTEPRDLSIGNGIAIGTRPMVDIGGNYPDCFIAATVDGNPIAIRQTISRETLDAIITPNGQEAMDLSPVRLPIKP